MNLTLHQFRHEFKRSRFGLVLYAVVLLCNLAVALDWIGAPSLRPDGSWNHGGMLSTLLILAYWIAFTSVVASCVVADSPARRDRFLATRPLPSLALTGGKLLFLAVAALLPAVVVEAIALRAAGAGAGTMLVGGLERLLFCGVIAFAVGSFAAHWKNMQTLLSAAAIAFAAVMILGQVIAGLLVHWLGRERFGPGTEPTFLTILQGVGVIGLGLALTAWICSRRGVLYRYLVPGLVPIAAAAVFVMMASPFRTTPYRPDDQATIDQFLENESASPAILSQGYRVSARQEDGELSASFSISPRTSGFPDDLEFRWDSPSQTWMVDGQVAHQESRDPHHLGRQEISPHAVPVSWALARAIQGHLETNVAFRLGNGATSSSSSSLSLHSLRYDPEGPFAGKDARIRTELAGDAFKWEVVADLPFESKKSAKDGNSTWSIANILKFGAHDIRVQLAQKTVALHTAGELNLRKIQSPWQQRNRFVLYLPDRQVAWIGSSQFARPLPSVSASKHYLGQIEFQEMTQGGRASFDPDTLANARLLVLRSKYVGRLTESWESPEFTLQTHPSHQGRRSTDYTDHERWNSAEFALWFHRWKKLSPDDDEELVHAHFLELFENLDRLERTLNDTREPVARYVARFVPRHLGFFIHRLPHVPHGTATVLTNAIAMGAEDDQREVILGNLVGNDALDVVVRLRGWEEQARAAHVTMARDFLNSGSRYIHDLLALGDPDLDELILDRYRANPQPILYETLRNVPRLAPATEKITGELWKPGRLVIQRNRYTGTLVFGLKQGRPEALEELFRLIDLLGADGADAPWELAQLISGAIHVPRDLREKRHDYEKIIAWAAKHRPSDFRFDPVFRRFVLKAANKTV